MMTYPAWLLPPQEVKPLKNPHPTARVLLRGRVYPSADAAATALACSVSQIRRMVLDGKGEYVL
jgi:hypothetical protein